MENQKDYKTIARKIRKDTLALIYKGQTSHIASCFSLADIITVLYENLKEEDLVIWSKGWASALYYIVGIRKGIFKREEVFGKFPDYPYPALLEPPTVGVYVPTGSVAHGLPVAVGMALGKKRAGEKGTIYCIMSDGEWDEGSVWEAALFAGHNKLDNLAAITDFNKWQALGRVKEVLDLEPAGGKWEAFNWNTQRINGHNYEEIEGAIKIKSEKPLMIIADTFKGEGCSLFRDHLLFHYAHVGPSEFEMAMKELS